MTTAVGRIKELLPTLSEDELLEVRALLDQVDSAEAIAQSDDGLSPDEREELDAILVQRLKEDAEGAVLEANSEFWAGLRKEAHEIIRNGGQNA